MGDVDHLLPRRCIDSHCGLLNLLAKLAQHRSKDSKAALIIRPEIHKREEIDENGEKSELVWTTYRSTNVFKLSDLEADGLTSAIDSAIGEVSIRTEPERLEAAEAVLRGWEVQPSFGLSRAFYQPSTDSICLPASERFETAAATAPMPAGRQMPGNRDRRRSSSRW
jgi:antirestriction protein ArdC